MTFLTGLLFAGVAVCVHIFATVKADGELADKFRDMVESEWSYSTYVDEFDDREGTLTI